MNNLTDNSGYLSHSVLHLVVILVASSGLHAQQPNATSVGDWEHLYMANYVQIEDLPKLQELGVNAVMMELDPNPSGWKETYQAVARHNMKLVPVLWGKHQSIWKWNSVANEWELDADRYNKSKGAEFIQFLKTNKTAREHTLAVYSFHEPWYIGEKGKRKGTVTPDKQRTFWKQIRAIFDGKMKVYGEEVTWVPECKNGCVDYDYVTLYSFAHRNGVVGYRPGGRFQVGRFGIDGSQAPFQNDKATAKQLEREQIDLMHRMIHSAPAAPDGTRTKLIALMGTFAHDEEPDLWNRMPTSEEMREWGREVIRPSRQRLAGTHFATQQTTTNKSCTAIGRIRTGWTDGKRWATYFGLYVSHWNPTNSLKNTAVRTGPAKNVRNE